MLRQRQPRPGESKTISVCAIIFVVIGIVIFQIFGKQWFPDPPDGGFAWQRVMWSGIVGAVSALIGAGVGIVIDKLIKK
ncbi:MAG: hypothetical protein L0215_22605 [Gemmataceae bacterium]|nr:hypothetical protein [Gemmataceae bacterium]